MSRLRRLALSDRFFFVTCKLLPSRWHLRESEFALLAGAVEARRKMHRFLLTAWVFLPDHWHAILLPRYPSTISLVMESIKVSWTRRINKLRIEAGLLWQGRFFDRALRTVWEYHEKVEYIHLNPVKRGLVQKPEDWKWSSIHDYTGDSARAGRHKQGAADRPDSVTRRPAGPDMKVSGTRSRGEVSQLEEMKNRRVQKAKLCAARLGDAERR